MSLVRREGDVTVVFDDPTYAVLFRYTKALSVALEYRDLYTQLHCERVVMLSHATGVRMGLSAEEQGMLIISATFHDIGKIGVPDRVLLKPGELDEEEILEMQKHPEAGATIVAAADLEGADVAAKTIRHHHENWNGSGYPDRIAGEDIPLCSRIIGIADSYDAMASRRAYHRAKTHEEIVAILVAETGVKHDPQVMTHFLDVIGSGAIAEGGDLATR